MIKAGIMGDDGLVSGELVRLLLGHPDVKLVCVVSSRHAGRPVAAVHRSLAGETRLEFVAEAPLEGLDVLIVADETWHGVQSLPEGLKVIDVTGRNRGEGWVYGLSEVNRKHMVHDCQRVWCPGDVAMAVLLAVLPLARNLMLLGDVNVTAVTGGGDGVACVPSPLEHEQHDEVALAIKEMQTSFEHDVNIMAVEGAVSSGVLAAVTVKSNVDLDVLRKLYDEYYDDHNFTYVVDLQPDVIDVLGTGKCYLHLERKGQWLVVTSVIDGLLKGAASNAVHCMNLMFGLQECTGLKVKL